MNESVFTKLVEQYHRPLIYFAFKRVKSMDIAEDIVADKLMNIWIKRNQVLDESKIKAFLYISTKNECLNYLKSKSSRRYQVSWDEVAVQDLLDDTDLHQQVIQSESLETIYQAMTRLPSMEKRILELTYLEEMDTQTICTELGINAQSVFTNRSRALTKLRKIFKKNTFILTNR